METRVDGSTELERHKPPPPPLPATKADLLAGYKLKRKRSINDLVEEIVLKLWETDQDFMRYVDPIYDSDSVEGTLDDDDLMAAQIIREVAKKEHNHEVASKNLHTIKLAMRVALKRFGVSRGERHDQAQMLKLAQPPTESAN